MQQSCSACLIDDYFPDYQFGCGDTYDQTGAQLQMEGWENAIP